MDLKEIQELIKFVAKSGATEVELEIDNVKISIKSPKRGKAGEAETTIIQQIPMPQAQPMMSMPATEVAPVVATETPVANDKKDDKESNYITIKSPMIGTFYRKPSPDKDNFVSVGDAIKPGDTHSVIEAMKLYNEIESEISGTIVKVLVEDSTPVEYDQPLFLVDPS